MFGVRVAWSIGRSVEGLTIPNSQQSHATAGFLVAYYMYNHDCNGMGAGEEHPGWVFRLPKVRFGFPHSRRRISRALCVDGWIRVGSAV